MLRANPPMRVRNLFGLVTSMSGWPSSALTWSSVSGRSAAACAEEKATRAHGWLFIHSRLAFARLHGEPLAQGE